MWLSKIKYFEKKIRFHKESIQRKLMFLNCLFINQRLLRDKTIDDKLMINKIPLLFLYCYIVQPNQDLLKATKVLKHQINPWS